MIDGQNYISGEWVAGEDSVVNINPSDTTDTIGRFARATSAQVKTAVQSAAAAFPAWSRGGVQQRHDILRKIGDGVLARKHELGRLLSREEGKTLAEGIGEVARAGQIFNFFAGECLRLSGEMLPSVRPGVGVEIVREALGVVGIITPWNFPSAIPAWKIAPALAYGNCVVFKPAELVAASAHTLTQIIATSGIPSGVFNLVMGQGRVIGDELFNSDDVAAISFTGSVGTGKVVAEACVKASRMKKFQLEMGGKNPLVVLDDADLSVAVDCMVQGSYFSTGQRCTASSRIIVTKGIHDKFIDTVKERMAGLVIGDALDENTQIGPVVDQSQFDQDLHYIQIGRNEGAKLLCGGEPVKREKSGFYLAPALFTDVDPQMRISQEEIFGPVAAVTCVRDYDEALAMANDTEFGLASGICTTSLKYASHFRQNAEAGMIMVNLPTAGVDYHVPFGGRKASSFGPREQGRYAQEFFTIVKTSYIQP